MLDQLLAAGHAVGQAGEWIRPKFDFVLQARELPGVEVELPSKEWFIEHAVGLKSELRRHLGEHLAAASGDELPQQVADDAAFANGWGYGLAAIRRRVAGEPERAELLSRALECFRVAVQAKPDDAQAWYNLGVALGQVREEETEVARRAELLDKEIAAYRAAVEVDPKHAQAWYNLASCLLTAANPKTEQDARSRRLTEALQAAHKAADLGAGRYNLACALALSGEKDRALEELEGCFARKEVPKYLVRQDPDWKGLRGDPELEALLE